MLKWMLSALLLVVLSLGLPLSAAHADDDWETVLGVVVAGGIIWGIVDGCDRPTPHRILSRYDPPSPYQHYGSPNYWYNEGYADGWSDGHRWEQRPQPLPHRDDPWDHRPAWSSPLPPSWHGQVPPQYRRADPRDRGKLKKW